MDLRQLVEIQEFRFLSRSPGDGTLFEAKVKLEGTDALRTLRGTLSWNATAKLTQLASPEVQRENLARAWIEDAVRAGFLYSVPPSSQNVPGFSDLGVLLEGQVEGLLTRRAAADRFAAELRGSGKG
jgi:hypothetical protein